MKPAIKHILCLTVIFLAGLFGSQAQTTKPPAGYWEGAISLPGTSLVIRVDLEGSTGEWSGTIDIPVQGMRGFKLGEVTVDVPTVSFTLPGIPGDPKFTGRLDATGRMLSGDFTQGGQTYPFTLERAVRPAGNNGETPSRGVPGKGIIGHWQGSLKPTPIMELRLALEITNSASGTPAGVMISLDQGSPRIPIDGVTDKSGAVHFSVKRIGGNFDGTFNEDGSEIKGEWKQGGSTLPVIFKRLEKAPKLSRPQEPTPPYPYEVEEVAFENPAGNFNLAGTLTLPSGPGPHPAVALISGSGPQDRDEAIMGHRPFLVLADHLTRNGVAVLRYDDRGIGKSGGRFAEATTADFTTDALAAVRFLKSRPEIDSRHIGLVGHSEGGIVAPMAAVQSDDVAFIVLLAGVGVPMDELLARQAADILLVLGGSQEMADKQAVVQRQIFAIVREQGGSPDAGDKIRQIMRKSIEDFTPEQLEAMGWSEVQLETQVQMVVSPWFRALLEIDPAPTLEKVRCPVLAINGDKDVQVAAKENLDAIQDALEKGGNQSVTIRSFPGLNHLFQTCNSGAIAEYGTIEETFNEAAMLTVSEWIKTTIGRQ